jgi:hypothetical protein
MKNVIVMDGEMYLKTIEKSPELISTEDIQKILFYSVKWWQNFAGRDGMMMNYV